MLEFTVEQHEAIAGNGMDPVRVIDPTTLAEYALVPAHIYDRVKSMLLDDIDWQEGAYAAAMSVFARDGWDDPRMDVYDALDPRKAA